MSRLIDADALERVKFHSNDDLKPVEVATWQWGWNDAIDAIIDNAPTVDAVEVVRCKDCKYFNGNMKFCDYNCQVKDDDYCSWGERKDEIDRCR